LAGSRRELVGFLIALAERDPAAPVALGRLGDAPNLAQDLIRFGLTGRLRYPGLDPQALTARIVAHPARVVGAIVREVRALLAAVADGREYQIRIPREAWLAFDGKSSKLLENVGFPGPQAWRANAGETGGLFALAVPADKMWSSLAPSFIFNAMRALDSEQGVMVRRCRRQACRKVFVAARPKQIYCSRPCNSAVAAETHREKVGSAKHRKEHAEQARKSYYQTRGREVPNRIFDRG
jgi:hypothetical protein